MKPADNENRGGKQGKKGDSQIVFFSRMTEVGNGRGHNILGRLIEVPIQILIVILCGAAARNKP